MVKGIGPKVLKCDGNDIISVYNNLKKATTEVRKGNGPFFLEFFTYRWLEHCGPNYDNNIGYRTEDEFRKWKKKDPINRLVKKFDNKSYNQIKKINRSVNKEIKEAFDFAEKSPFPHQSEAYKGVYA